MKITSHYRGKETELVNESSIQVFNQLICELNDGVTLKQNRHYNGNEKFYEVKLTRKEIDLIADKLPKSKLVQFAEKIDSLIERLQNSYNRG